MSVSVLCHGLFIFLAQKSLLFVPSMLIIMADVWSFFIVMVYFYFILKDCFEIVSSILIIITDASLMPKFSMCCSSMLIVSVGILLMPKFPFCPISGQPYGWQLSFCQRICLLFNDCLALLLIHIEVQRTCLLYIQCLALCLIAF